MGYPFSEIEPKWQKYWEENNIYATSDSTDKPKYYILDMFPYPSGAGLHIGHPEGYTASDILGRYKLMKGFNVLHPMGFDAFGLPTERYSMKTGIHPAIATEENIKNFIRQLKMIGFGYDWDRVVNTTDPNYYKWTQWMFLLIYNSWYDEVQQKARHIDELPIPNHLTSHIDIENYKDDNRLAYISMIPVNWCEDLGTVLANEEVEEWRSKGHNVERRPMRQWMIRITKYAQRLLEDLELVDWPYSTKEMQKNWIGRSEGANLWFDIEGSSNKVMVYTTRPDTLFGASYLVLAPEHELVPAIVTPDRKEDVDRYIHDASFKTDLERTTDVKQKSGVFTGAYAINPGTGKSIPIWIADYVLISYGTGSIMAVPGHDQRDHEFAKAFGLPIIQVVAPEDGSDINFQDCAFTDYGINVNSANSEFSINGLTTLVAKQKTIEWAQDKGIGNSKIQFKLRDWLFSRQRYWGEPIPIILFEDGTKRSLDIDELPLELPKVNDFMPAGTGESPLAKVPEWVKFTDKKTGKIGGYETNTMPQWAGSCWYYLRYIDPSNHDVFADKDKEKYWMSPGGVDFYIGGAEHAVLHLLYARFWHKLLYDYEHVSTKEPFKKLFHQGLILGSDQRKMSKSLGNVVNPDDVIAKFGADSLRVFEMFMGPLADAKPWSEKGIEGVNRFLNRAWRLFFNDDDQLLDNITDDPMDAEQEFVLHSTIKKVAEDIEELRFNTAISQMMIFVNEFTKMERRPRKALESFILCLAPFAPHMAEEIWQRLGNKQSIVKMPFPELDTSKLVRNQIEFVLQVSSKIRGKILVEPDREQLYYEEMAMTDEKTKSYLENKIIRKIIFVPNKLINFIVSDA